MKNYATLALVVFACAPSVEPPPTADTYVGAHRQTLRFGELDNSEVIKLLPTGVRAVLVASKARKVTLLSTEGGALTELRSAVLFSEDASDSELTHIDFNSAGTFAVVTRTLPTVDADGALTACAGSLVFVDVSDSASFGTVLRELPVGPMPDAVDISDDDNWVVSADEVDFNDGKCTLDGAAAGISVVELVGGDPAAARLRATITMNHAGSPNGLKREPEQIIFAPDHDRVAATLQDTHELLVFSVAAILEGSDPTVPVTLTSDDVTVTAMTNRGDGSEPWPDGVTRVLDGEGATYFAVAGEFNDTVHLFDIDGAFVSQLELGVADLPGDAPRGESPAALRPDSISGFRFAGRSYLALSLKHVGAVGVVDVTDIGDMRVHQVIKIGDDDQGTGTSESTIGTEGISAHDSGVIVTANEGESSASLVSVVD